MAVILTNKDMPETCVDCDLIAEDGNREDYCVITKEYCRIYKVLDKCPLRPIEGLIEQLKHYRELPVKQTIEIIKAYCGMEE